MWHEMRAEYGDGPTPGAGNGNGTDVKVWHMVRNGGTRAMCGRRLEEEAETRPEEAWSRMSEPFCHSCGALYLREVP